MTCESAAGSPCQKTLSCSSPFSSRGETSRSSFGDRLKSSLASESSDFA